MIGSKFYYASENARMDLERQIERVRAWHGGVQMKKEDKMTGQFCYFCGNALRESRVDDGQVCGFCGAKFENHECMPQKKDAGAYR